MHFTFLEDLAVSNSYLQIIFKELQWVTNSYLANSRIFSIARASILGVLSEFMMLCIFTPVNCLDLTKF